MNNYYKPAKKFGVDQEKGSKIVYPLGFIQAVCSTVIDLGMQESKSAKYGNKTKHGCMFFFEFEDRDLPPDDNGSYVKTIAKRYPSINFSTEPEYKSNLQKDLESWRGKIFSQEEIDSLDLNSLYGVNCTILIEKNDKYTNVTKIVAKQKGAENLIPIRKFDDPYPEWIQKSIDNRVDVEGEDDEQDTKTYRTEEQRNEAQESFDDDIPF